MPCQTSSQPEYITCHALDQPPCCPSPCLLRSCGVHPSALHGAPLSSAPSRPMLCKPRHCPCCAGRRNPLVGSATPPQCTLPRRHQPPPPSQPSRRVLESVSLPRAASEPLRLVGRKQPSWVKAAQRAPLKELRSLRHDSADSAQQLCKLGEAAAVAPPPETRRRAVVAVSPNLPERLGFVTLKACSGTPDDMAQPNRT